jgi:hypothetical protein
MASVERSLPGRDGRVNKWWIGALLAALICIMTVATLAATVTTGGRTRALGPTAGLEKAGDRVPVACRRAVVLPKRGRVCLVPAAEGVGGSRAPGPRIGYHHPWKGAGN